VKVECYDDLLPLTQIAYVSILGPEILQVIPYDRALIGAIRRGLHNSKLPLSPTVEGDRLIVKVPIPDIDDRKKLEKHVKKLAEAQRVAIRQIRRKARKAGENEKTVEDLVKEYINKIDDLLAKKVEDLNPKSFF